MITGEQVYSPALKSGHSNITIEGSEFHHLIRVRRFELGQEIWVVNGDGLACLTKIDSIGLDTLDLKVLREERDRGELSTQINLVMANLKGDHLDLIVEKTIELGVHEIYPLITDHTIKKGLKKERLERIAISAMKQSRRSRLPTIHELQHFKTFVGKHQDGQHLFCHAADSAIPLQANQKISASDKIYLWIGPEGDWSKDEIDLASISDYTFTGLGPRRLRAETAAIHAVGLLSALLQDPA